MAGLKDLVAKDIDRVFLNLNDFGTEHDVEGKSIICVIDEDGLQDRQGGAEMAVGQSTMTLYAKREDLPDRKGYGAELMVDGIPYIINTWRESIGMTIVNLFISVNS